jgi:uncharacterized protein
VFFLPCKKLETPKAFLKSLRKTFTFPNYMVIFLAGHGKLRAITNSIMREEVFFMAREEFPLERQLRKDIQDAQRARDQLKLDTLRMALGAIHNLEVARTDRKNAEFGQPLTEGDTLKVLEQEIKKRSQAIPFYKQGGRTELVEKEQREMEILQGYLQGTQLSDDELRALVAQLIDENGKEFRKVMPLAAKETKGRAEGARVQQIVREMTA